MNLQSKYLEDSSGNKYAPITTPNAVRFPNGENLNDKLIAAETINITLATSDSPATSPLSGVHIKIVSNENPEEVIYNTTWGGTQITTNVPTTATLRLIVEDEITDYFKPHDVVFTPKFGNTRNVTLTYRLIADAIDSIYIDDTISDPNKKITGDVNGDVIKYIRSNFHRYAAVNDNGTLKVCQTDDNNSLFLANGDKISSYYENFELYVCCKVPIYTHYEVDNTLGHARHKISFSVGNHTNWKDWHFGIGSNKLAIGAFKACNYNNNPASMMWQTPVLISYSDIGIVKEYLLTNTRFAGWAEHCIMNVLFYAIYGTTDSVRTLGYGGHYTAGGGKTPRDTGITCDIGMKDTKYSDNLYNRMVHSTTFINFCGLEDWYGNGPEIMVDAKFHNQSANAILDIVNSSGTVLRSFTFPTPSNVPFWKSMVFGENLDIVPTSNSVETQLTDITEGSDYCCIQDIGLVEPDLSEFLMNRGGWWGDLLNSPGEEVYYTNAAFIGVGGDGTFRLCFEGTIQELTASDFMNLITN